jgi:Fur family ferric uptake transcriptional regulator
MNSEVRSLIKLLKKNRHYVTQARLRLFKILQDRPALSIKELIGLLPKHDQATVYRNITIFENLGVIARLRLGRQSKLELSDMFQHHHHHLTCLKCGRVIALAENTKLEREINQLSKSRNFKPTDHQLEIRGYCSNCQSLG